MGGRVDWVKKRKERISQGRERAIQTSSLVRLRTTKR
jgi:hypothetical protein